MAKTKIIFEHGVKSTDMNSKAEKILAKGLTTGYAGGSDYQPVTRGPFTLKATELAFPEDNASYNDHWIFKRTGGGQEIARSGDEMATRVFAGGVVKPEKLAPLGITEPDVLAYHKKKLSELSGSTRLHETIAPVRDGEWEYSYEVVKRYPDVPLTMGVESIRYKGQGVFVHVFLVTPIA